MSGAEIRTDVNDIKSKVAHKDDGQKIIIIPTI